MCTQSALRTYNYKTGGSNTVSRPRVTKNVYKMGGWYMNPSSLPGVLKGHPFYKAVAAGKFVEKFLAPKRMLRDLSQNGC